MAQSAGFREPSALRHDHEFSDAVIGTAAVVAESAIGAGRALARFTAPGVRFALRPPLVPEAWQPARALEALVRRGEAERLAARRVVEGAISVMLPALVARLAELVPINDLILTSVDIDALMTDVDIDAIAARIDVDAIIGRVDLVTLVQEIIVEIDLPEIIRQSSGSIAAETVRGVRMRGIEADGAVERLVDRLRLRRADASPPDPPPSTQPDPTTVEPQ